MPNFTPSDVQPVLRDKEKMFADLILRAWDKWLEQPERAGLYKRTRGTLVHNFAMIDAKARIAPGDGIIPVEQHETILFLIDDKVAARIKKGDEEGKSSNIGTQSALDFVDPQATFASMPAVCKVDIAYILNALETQISEILIVHRDGDKVKWSYSIYSQNAGEFSTPITFPKTPIAPPPADSGMRVPNKKIEKQNKKA